MSQETEKGYSKIEWLFYIIILPIIFISILTVVVLWFLDYDVKEKVFMALNNVPVIEKLIDDEQFTEVNYVNKNLSKDELQFQVDELKITLNEKNQVISQNDIIISAKDEEIILLNEQIDALKIEINEKNTSEKTREQEIADLAKIYENMNPKNAANIISYLSLEESALILKSMSLEAKSSILEKMDQRKAADISILLKDQEYSKDQDIRALQERISELIKEIDSLEE